MINLFPKIIIKHSHHIAGAVAHHTVHHAARVGVFSSFKNRFINSFVRTGVYRFFRKIGLLWSGQPLIIHAIIVALAGCLIAWIIKLLKRKK